MENKIEVYLKNIISEDIRQKDEKIDLIFELICDLFKGGVIQNGNGYCLAMSDLLQKILSFHNIESDLVECSLLIVDSNQFPPNLTMVGHESNIKTTTDNMQNHVVVVTKAKVPLLIDLSLYERVDNVPVVIGTLSEDKELSLASIQINKGLFKYSKKPISSIPYLHQQSIVNKLSQDKKIKKEIDLIKNLLILLFFVSGTNFIRGVYDHYQKYIIEDNGFGPSKEFIKE